VGGGCRVRGQEAGGEALTTVFCSPITPWGSARRILVVCALSLGIMVNCKGSRDATAPITPDFYIVLFVTDSATGDTTWGWWQGHPGYRHIGLHVIGSDSLHSGWATGATRPGELGNCFSSEQKAGERDLELIAVADTSYGAAQLPDVTADSLLGNSNGREIPPVSPPPTVQFIRTGRFDPTATGLSRGDTRAHPIVWIWVWRNGGQEFREDSLSPCSL